MVKKIKQQLKDDSGGKPWVPNRRSQFLAHPTVRSLNWWMTGRHMTLRVDGNSAEHVALGGPISTVTPRKMMKNPITPATSSGIKRCRLTRCSTCWMASSGHKHCWPSRPASPVLRFVPRTRFPACRSRDVSRSEKQVESTLRSLVEPYRQADQDEILACLKRQGGLDACRLSFYSDNDIGDDKVWDNWRLEGPSFVWYFRGSPHVHIWINVADDPSVKTNA